LTVRCFPNDRRPDSWCPAYTAGLGRWPRWCPRQSAAGQVPAAFRTLATSADTEWSPWGSHRGHATCATRAGRGPWDAAVAGHGRVHIGERGGVRSAWPAQLPVRHRSGPAADTAGHFCCGRPGCRPTSGHARTLCRVRCPPAGCVLRGTGHRGGGRWWDATNAGEREPAGRSGGRGADREHRSSPAW
jgi:hypothetical protein